MADEPTLLRIPHRFRNVGEVLETAQKMNLPNVLILSELDDGKIVFLETEMSVASTNWLLDRMKMLLLMPESFQKSDR